MDAAEYLPMFLEEAREHLQSLNLAVVRIEETPNDGETIDEIFRAAHSLKGMSATMGFAGIAELTHEMENVFELLRQRSTGLDRDAIDALLACLDALEGAVDAIDTDGVERIDPAPLIAKLRALGRAPKEETDAPAGPPSAEEIADRAGGHRYVELAIQLSDEVAMPGVRAYMVLAALADHGELIGSWPAHEAVDGFDGKEIQAWLVSDHEDDVVTAAARAVDDVSQVSLIAHEPVPAKEEEEAPAETAAKPETAAAPKQAKKGSSSVRVDAARLDQLMHFMGELVVHRTHVESLVAHTDQPELVHAMQSLTRSSQALQAMVMQVRMIEVEAVFLRFPRLVRDLSSKLGKQVDLRLTGGETELDRTVVEALGDPIVHLVRNSLDHGLESPEVRERGGKPATGTLEIAARHAGGNVVITVRDDGRGIDPQAVARKAAERGLIASDAVAAVDMSEAIELLFTPGFSTAEQTSDISGRGVGMDAVRDAVRNLGGEVVMESKLGEGTTALIRLPLTLAIMSTLLVEAGGMPFAIPVDRVERTLLLRDHTIRSVAGQPMLVLRDGVLPLVDAAEVLGHARGETENAVIVRVGESRLALAVTRLVGQRELVTRPLPSELGDRGAVSGGAVLSNGEIALIVDCDSLTRSARTQLSTKAQAA
ncbi:MAG: Hpt domain-containing protein [Thermoleophilaceae bacterium]